MQGLRNVFLAGGEIASAAGAVAATRARADQAAVVAQEAA